MTDVMRAVLCLLLGTFCLGYGLWLLPRHLRMRRQWTQVPGEVVSWRATEVHEPVIAYRAADGSKHLHVPDYGLGYWRPKVGTPCRIWHDPADPERAISDYKGGGICSAVIELVAGSLLLTLGVAFALEVLGR